MSKHTPGPWTACAGDDCKELQVKGKRTYFPHVHLGPADHGKTYVSGDGSTCPARSTNITINEGETMETVDANARLIAAAPDLAAFAERFLDSHGEGQASECVGEGCMCGAARAALKKAGLR